MKRLSIDFECAARDWWKAGGQELWDSIAEGFDGSSVVLDDDLVASWLVRAREIPGWDAGPDYAPHPVAVSELAEDEDFI